VIATRWWAAITRKFELFDARKRDLEGLEKVLAYLERATFVSPMLERLGSELEIAGRSPSRQFRVLRFWAGWAELRFQWLIHPFANVFLMWDVHILRAIERWNKDVGQQAARWLNVVGSFEALASLATLHGIEPHSSFPCITDGGPFEAKQMEHPLLDIDVRVANDLCVPGSGSVVVVTGSNMAGKSTLLRTVGLNLALAFAGGPVCAASLRTPAVRLRASMRASDSLQAGASYFYAELEKLKSVIRAADQPPPVFFLLDELLRGTNARARGIGARAVVRYLMSKGAFGIVATHEYALCEQDEESNYRTINAHFTDVLTDGNMTFDYKVRSGAATTSNALLLLELAGIPVHDAEQTRLRAIDGSVAACGKG
jgi:DNA mismatch repair ATPase MutS